MNEQLCSGFQLLDVGVSCALGEGKEAVCNGLLAGDRSGLVSRSGLLTDTDTLVGSVNSDFNEFDNIFASQYKAFDSRNNRLLLSVYRQIEDVLQPLIGRFGNDRVGIVLGTSTSGVEETELALVYRRQNGEWPPGYHNSLQEFGDPARFLSNYLEVNGPAYCISTACSSSAKVFGSARRLLETGQCDVVLLGGVDTLCKLTLNGFSALESLSKNYCEPFSRHRDGINIGEACALTIMVRAEPTEEGIYLLGIGESSDAYHISAPHPEGKGAVAAIQSAMEDARLNADEISYINLHGTATIQNDAMESKAVAAVLGDQVPASSTKSLTGHTLGAAGALEAAFCWLLLSDYNRECLLPAQVPGTELDESLEPIQLVLSDYERKMKPGAVMSNSFAFGGSNVSLVLGTADYIR